NLFGSPWDGDGRAQASDATEDALTAPDRPPRPSGRRGSGRGRCAPIFTISSRSVVKDHCAICSYGRPAGGSGGCSKWVDPRSAPARQILHAISRQCAAAPERLDGGHRPSLDDARRPRAVRLAGEKLTAQPAGDDQLLTILVGSPLRSVVGPADASSRPE